MKKQAFLLAAAVLVFASCQNEPMASGGYTDAQVDSIVNARVHEQILLMQSSNDSVINALAAKKADSILATMKGDKKVVTKAPPAPPRNTGKANNDDVRQNVEKQPLTKDPAVKDQDGRIDLKDKKDGRIDLKDKKDGRIKLN